MAAYFQGTREILARCLREAQEAHQIAGADVGKLAFTLEALIQGAIFQFAFLDARGIESHLCDHVTTFLHPWMTRPADGQGGGVARSRRTA